MAAARRQHLSTLALLWASAAALHPSHRVTHASQKYRLDTVRSIDVRLSEARMRGKCILVAGANGRTGAALCRELLRSQPSVQVRALVRSNEPESSSRLSYETGAEEAEYSLRPAWALDEEEGGFAKLQVRGSEAQSGYGLDRLQIVPCDLRVAADVARAVRGVDGVFWCATEVDASRRWLPPSLAKASRSLSVVGRNIFELRLPFLNSNAADDREEDTSTQAVESVDTDGLQLMIETFSRERGRSQKLSLLTGGMSSTKEADGIDFVLASAAASLCSRGAGADLQESSFGAQKRRAEEILRASGLSHAIVRANKLDDLIVEEGLPLQLEEVTSFDLEDTSDKQGRKMHPRDFAKALLGAWGTNTTDGVTSRTLEVWTTSS